jgi:hypothetical protein
MEFERPSDAIDMEAALPFRVGNHHQGCRKREAQRRVDVVNQLQFARKAHGWG